jgi:hypothetical protein
MGKGVSAMSREMLFPGNTIMYDRASATPTINNHTNAGVSFFNVFSSFNPVVVQV